MIRSIYMLRLKVKAGNQWTYTEEHYYDMENAYKAFRYYFNYALDNKNEIDSIYLFSCHRNDIILAKAEFTD